MFNNFKHKHFSLGKLCGTKFRNGEAIYTKIVKMFSDGIKDNMDGKEPEELKEPKEQDKFFYDKNLENAINSNNLISVKKDSKMKSKLTLNEPLEQPLIDNEAYRELYRNFSVYIGEQSSKELDIIVHNEERNGKLHKYGLPAKNELPFTELIPQEEADELPKTSTESLFELLELDKDSSYESLILKFQGEFNHEADMYGNVVKAGETKHAVFEYGIPIPLETIKDEKIMTRVRSFALYNVDLPGNIEDVHPNKFIANLRPIEEFRHTPVVPISEKDINEYRKKIEEKSRMGVYFEVKKQTLYYYGIGILFVVILYQTFRYFHKESENMQTEIQKIRLRRLRYREEDDIV